MSSPTESVSQSISEDTSNQPVRRRRRRQDDASTETSSISSPINNTESNNTESTKQNVEDCSPDTPLMPNCFPVQNNDVDFIRAEIREDNYHAQLAESDFSDDTHDWGGDSHDFSEDYWNFLGSFE